MAGFRLFRLLGAQIRQHQTLCASEMALWLRSATMVGFAMIRSLSAASVVFITIMAGCARRTPDTQDVTGGNSANGRRLLYSYGCGSCHTIPGVGEADGTIGPPLRGFANRIYIAGLLQNTPENLFRWISQPQEVQPGNAMPDLGVTEAQARDMAAYLYTLR